MKDRMSMLQISASDLSSTRMRATRNWCIIRVCVVTNLSVSFFSCIFHFIIFSFLFGVLNSMCGRRVCSMSADEIRKESVMLPSLISRLQIGNQDTTFVQSLSVCPALPLPPFPLIAPSLSTFTLFHNPPASFQ